MAHSNFELAPPTWSRSRNILLSPDDSGSTGKGTQDPNGKTTSGEAKGSEKKNTESQTRDEQSPVVTADILKQITSQLQKDISGSVSSKFDDLRSQLDTQRQEIETLRNTAKTVTSNSDNGKAGGEKENAELVDLRKKLAEYENRLIQTQSEMDAAQKREKETAFKHQVMEALTNARCKKPDVAFAYMRDTLERDGDRIFKTVDSPYGRKAYDLPEYIKEVFSEEILPELFEGKVRAGSAAGGDHGGSDGQWLYTKEQVEDPEFYMANREDVLKAIDQGKVKGIPAPSSKGR